MNNTANNIENILGQYFLGYRKFILYRQVDWQIVLIIYTTTDNIELGITHSEPQ